MVQSAEMKRIFAVVLVLELLAACGGLPPVPPASVVTRRLRADPVRAWQAARQVLDHQGYQIVQEDRSTGTLETAWSPINPEYRASFWLTEQRDRYSQCAKPGLGQAYEGKEGRLRLQVSPSEKPDETALAVQATFRTALARGSSGGHARPRVFCRSTGWLEDELALRIELVALGGRLERLRRGGHR
jgi:hypothetical protein